MARLRKRSSISMPHEWWSSRYGSTTSLRVGVTDGQSLEQSAKLFESDFLKALPMDSIGLAIQPVKFLGLRAASGTTDFSGLFIGFSFFMILSGLMLISLLVRLGIERRASEIGLLSAIGFSPSRIGRVLLLEQCSVVLFGAVIGIAASAGYAGLLIFGLGTLWVGAVGTTELRLSIQPGSLVIGFVGTLLAAGASAWLGLRGLQKLSPRKLLAGQTELVDQDDARHGVVGCCGSPVGCCCCRSRYRCQSLLLKVGRAKRSLDCPSRRWCSSS